MSKKPSLLDANQVLQHAFDDDTQALRVDTQATVIEGNLEVAVDHQTDSIKIGDGARLAEVTDDKAIKVSNGLVKDSFDYFSADHSSVSSVYVYRKGGPTGSVVATVTINYTDITKSEISSLQVE